MTLSLQYFSKMKFYRLFCIRRTIWINGLH